ncbi:MAG: NUDIX domain-containing protein [Actinomycetota bacterium]
MEPRLAATVVPARDGPRGVEVLVMRRAPKHRFLPGFVVFPGGAVDPADGRLAERWFGTPDQASRACGIRELIEEAGLVLTANGLAPAPPRALDVVDVSPPRVEDMPEICHWIAPEIVPVRFDARFYAVAAPGGLEPAPDGEEAERAWWARPFDLLESNASGGVSLYWPTMKIVEGLATCAAVEEVLELQVAPVEPEVQIV